MIYIRDWHGFGEDAKGQALLAKVLSIAKPDPNSSIDFMFDGTLEEFVKAWGRERFVALPADEPGNWIVGVTKYNSFGARG